MAFVHGKQTKVVANEYDLSSFFNQSDMSWEVDTPETTTYGNNDRTFIGGLRGQTINFGGFWDPASGGTDDVIPPDIGAAGAILISFGPDGLTVGDVVYSMQCFYTNYTVSSPVDGVVTVSLDVQGTARNNRGLSIHDLTSETTTGEGTSVDNGASSSAGLIAYLHVTAWNATTLDVKIEDSTNDSVWADVPAGGFTQATGVTSERIATSTSELIDRYVHLDWVLSGTSATFTVSFQRL